MLENFRADREGFLGARLVSLASEGSEPAGNPSILRCDRRSDQLRLGTRSPRAKPASMSREESATGLSACGAGRRPPDPVPGPQHPKQALTNDTQSSRRLRHSGSKRAANVRIRLRSTMRDPIAKSPKSRMNRAIARPSSSIVVTLEPACHAGGRGFESRRSRLYLQGFRACSSRRGGWRPRTSSAPATR